MYLDDFIETSWNRYTKSYYTDLGYNFTKDGDKFLVKPSDLHHGSSTKCLIKCPKCSKVYFRQQRIIITKGFICPNCSKTKNILNCERCGLEVKSRRSINGIYYCSKCYLLVRRNFRKSIYEPNDITIKDNYAEVILRNRLGDIVAKSKIDLDDLDTIKEFKWRYYDGRVKTVINNKTIDMTHILLKVNDGVEVDHIDRNPLNNSKSNLRLVSHKQNCLNRGGKINMLYLGGIKELSVVDGIGFRYVIFCSGCPHRCNGCHNKHLWELESGNEVSVEELFENIKNLPDHVNITFSGGEPFFQAKAFSNLAKKIKENTNKTIWCYTGFRYEDLIESNKEEFIELLKNIDVLVDGPFILEQRDITLPFRGSSNQRIIDVRKSIIEGKVVEIND